MRLAVFVTFDAIDGTADSGRDASQVVMAHSANRAGTEPM